MTLGRVIYMVLSGGMVLASTLFTAAIVLSLIGSGASYTIAHAGVITILLTPPIMLFSYAVYSAVKRRIMDLFLALGVLATLLISIIIGASRTL